MVGSVVYLIECAELPCVVRVCVSAGSRFGSDVSLCTPRLQASIAATPKWEGHHPKRQEGEGVAVCHSLRYVTADVAFSTAAASARLGKFTDALSLLKFAEINGARAKVYLEGLGFRVSGFRA